MAAPLYIQPAETRLHSLLYLIHPFQRLCLPDRNQSKQRK